MHRVTFLVPLDVAGFGVEGGHVGLEIFAGVFVVGEFVPVAVRHLLQEDVEVVEVVLGE